MISHKEVEEYVLSMPNTRLEYPFGDEVAVYKVSKKPLRQAQDRQKAASTSSGQAKSKTDDAGRGDPDADGRGKMFALIAEGKDPVRISLKCDPLLAKVLREKYDEVQPGFHLNKKHWNTIVLSGQLPWEEVQGLIRHSYDLVTGDHDAQTPNHS